MNYAETIRLRLIYRRALHRLVTLRPEQVVERVEWRNVVAELEGFLKDFAIDRTNWHPKKKEDEDGPGQTVRGVEEGPPAA